MGDGIVNEAECDGIITIGGIPWWNMVKWTVMGKGVGKTIWSRICHRESTGVEGSNRLESGVSGCRLGVGLSLGIQFCAGLSEQMDSHTSDNAFSSMSVSDMRQATHVATTSVTASL